MARATRTESKARTRSRLIAAARRLFVEQGYAATSLEQIALAADVTKGAIYGHFESKEDLLLSAIEDTPSPAYPRLVDASRPLAARLEEFGRSAVRDPALRDAPAVAAWLEFVAALLRNASARARFADDLTRRLEAYAADDPDEPARGTTKVEVWAIGHALTAGLQLYRLLVPELLGDDVFARAVGLLAGLYTEPEER